MNMDVCRNDSNKIQTMNPDCFLRGYGFCHIAYQGVKYNTAKIRAINMLQGRYNRPKILRRIQSFQEVYIPVCTYKNNTNNTYDAMNFKHFFGLYRLINHFGFVAMYD